MVAIILSKKVFSDNCLLYGVINFQEGQL